MPIRMVFTNTNLPTPNSDPLSHNHPSPNPRLPEILQKPSSWNRVSTSQECRGTTTISRCGLQYSLRQGRKRAESRLRLEEGLFLFALFVSWSVVIIVRGIVSIFVPEWRIRLFVSLHAKLSRNVFSSVKVIHLRSRRDLYAVSHSVALDHHHLLMVVSSRNAELSHAFILVGLTPLKTSPSFSPPQSSNFRTPSLAVLPKSNSQPPPSRF